MHEVDLSALVRRFVDGVENLEREIDKLNANKVAAYKAAKASGVDPKALKMVIGYRRKRAKNPSAMAESEAVFKKYLDYADGAAASSPATARPPLHAREEAEEAAPATSTVAPEAPSPATAPEASAPTPAVPDDVATVEVEEMAEVREPSTASPKKPVEIEGTATEIVEVTEIVETAPVHGAGPALTSADLDDLLADLELGEVA